MEMRYCNVNKSKSIAPLKQKYISGVLVALELCHSALESITPTKYRLSDPSSTLPCNAVTYNSRSNTPMMS
jgi:hypothetical protein